MSAGAPAMNLIERPQWYVGRFPNTGLVAGQASLNFPLQTDTDAPFRMTGVAVYVFSSLSVPPGAAGNVGVSLRFARPDGSWIQKHLVSAQQLNPYDTGPVTGFGGQPPPFYSYFAPLGTNIFYPAGSAIVIDLQQLPAVTDIQVLVVFMGTKMYETGRVWAPSYTADQRTRPYFGYNLQAAVPSQNVPLNINPDAGFVWRSGAQAPGSPVAIGVRFKDWNGKYYMNDFVPADLIFGFNNAQAPGLIYPEIYIPKQQALYFDLSVLP